MSIVKNLAYLCRQSTNPVYGKDFGAFEKASKFEFASHVSTQYCPPAGWPDNCKDKLF